MPWGHSGSAFERMSMLPVKLADKFILSVFADISTLWSLALLHDLSLIAYQRLLVNRYV